MTSVLKEAEAAFRRGDYRVASNLYRQGFTSTEPDLISLLLAARSFLVINDETTALDYYNQAIALAPSHATAFSRKSSYLLAKRFGAVTPPAAVNPQISMRSLGNKGRFGNQVFQYGFLKCYADRFSLDIGTMEWPGTFLFPIHDPRPNTPTESTREGRFDMPGALLGNDNPLSGKEVTGYFQFHTAQLSAFRLLWQNTFCPSVAIEPIVCDALEQLRTRADTLVVLHLRRGDFVSENLPIAPSAWYQRWLETHWSDLDNPLLYIATDAPELLSDFRRFNALNLTDLDIDAKGFEFALDWFMLQSADILAASNSTFSISAAMSNKCATIFLRPRASEQKLVHFDPWNTDVLTD